MSTALTLMDIYNRMLERYGPQHWWPAETRFEVMVGAVLTQSAAWSNVEKAIAELKAAGALSPHALRRLPLDQLAQLVYSSGYYNAKARKLKALAEYLGRRFQDDLGAMAREESDSLKVELMGVHGIGEETADDILLYAVGKPAFVIDTYTRRLFSRMELVPETGQYSTCQGLFTANLPPDPELFGEYHALIVRHAVETCQKQPICHGCCLLEICPTGKRNLSSRPVPPGLAPST